MKHRHLLRAVLAVSRSEGRGVMSTLRLYRLALRANRVAR